MPIISSLSSDHTLSDLVEKIRAYGAGLGFKDDRVGYLSSDVASGDTTIPVDDASQFAAGWYEIDLELIRVKGVNTQSNQITVAPGGRGYRGTQATAHTAGTEIQFTPIMPRSIVTDEINREIVGAYPLICGIDTHEEVVDDATVLSYGIPADAEAVLDVRQRNIRGEWYRVTSWETEFSASATDFPTGCYVRVGQPIPAGNTLQVVYAKRPSQLTGLDDHFSATGLPDSYIDVVELGVLVRLLPAFDMARLSNLTVPENDISAQRQIGGGTIISRDLKAQYQARLLAERAAFAKKYPPRLHRVS